MSEQKTIKVLFCCTGNICRSPMAEGVFKRHVAEAGLSDRIKADSAGTHDYHVGAAPDARAQKTAAKRGYDISKQHGRQIIRRDFSEYDYVLAMDAVNMRYLARLCPAEHAHKLKLLMEYARGATSREVPDPYYGSAVDFEWVLDLVESASEGLLDHIRTKLDNPQNAR
jgi:protein-tyrosine phosphatase